MVIFWKILATIFAIWFVMLCMRPRTKEEWKRHFEGEEHRKKIDKLRHERELREARVYWASPAGQTLKYGLIFTPIFIIISVIIYLLCIFWPLI